MCDKTVVVIAPEETRIARVIARDGSSRADVERRIAAQIDPDLARRRADYVVENDDDLEVLRERSDAVYDALLRDLAEAARR
jgi:dephospho-CoA kinase